MKQVLQVIVNGHVIRVEAEEGTRITDFKATALIQARYGAAEVDRWNLVDGAGSLVTAEFVGDAPALTYLTLPAGIGA